MSKVCLAIGVGDAPPLDYLRGAVNGAHAMVAWAGSQGYTTHLLTDEVNPVEFDDVMNALTGLLSGGADRLIVYFAGHGVSTGAADDLWLLSNWNQVRQGISLLQLRNRLMRYGIRQLITISDACRTLIDQSTNDVTGNPVLMRGPFDEVLPQMDFWYASSPSRAAWMIPGSTPQESRCIFSGLLIEALRGFHIDAFDMQDPSQSITNFALADFMDAKVPEVAAIYGAELTPAITTAIRPPRHIYVPEVQPLPSEDDLIPWPKPADVDAAGMGEAPSGNRLAPEPGTSWTTRNLHELAMTTEPTTLSLREMNTFDDSAISRAEQTEQVKLAATLELFQAEQYPTHYETDSGFSVSGAQVVSAKAGPTAAVSLDKNVSSHNSWWRVDPGAQLAHPLPLLVELADDRWVGAAALPRFVASFTLDSTGSQAVIFRSMDDPVAAETEQTMAELFASGLRREQAPRLLERLRRAKHVDPMLGVLAAYLHEAMGDIANVHRTAYYYAQRDESIPFDIALLGRLQARRDADGVTRVVVPAVDESEGARNMPAFLNKATPRIEGVLAGAFPWMRQGWALLDPEGRPDMYREGLAEITSHLLPAPFTTLDVLGGRRLADLIY